MSLKAIAAASAILIACGATPATATAFCDVRQTRNGFVALRNGPSPSAQLIRRMKAGESVQIDSTVRERNGWMKVLIVGADRSLSVPGWVNRRLVERECG